MITENDALGGAGSIGGSSSNPFKDAVAAIAVTGLSRAVDGFLSKKFPLTSFNETETVNASGTVTPASAPSSGAGAGAGFAAAISNPVVIAVGVSLIAAVALFFALRR